MTNSKIPYGGVIKPIIELTTTSTPKCTRSIPSASQVGMNNGTITRMIVVASRMQPNSRISTLTAIRNAIGLMSDPSNSAEIDCGICSEITMKFRINAPPITMPTAADERALSMNTCISPRSDSAR